MTMPHDPRFCSCCVSPAPSSPFEIWNRPGLSEISYRVGTFASFRQTLFDAIADEPSLAALTTRDSDDFAITVLELFSAVGDVLTFYNERIANEMFLRTARERDSVLRLVRLISYRLNPGLAATTMLAFSLDADAQTRIRNGLKVMSVPGQDERPQTFETIEQITAHADLNQPSVFSTPFPFNAFHKGRMRGPVLSYPEDLAEGDRLVVFGLESIEEKTMEGLVSNSAGDYLEFTPAIQKDQLWFEVARMARMERRLRFFGHNAPEFQNVYIPGTPGDPWPKWGRQTVVSRFSSSATSYPLDTRYEDIKTGMHFLVDAGEGEPTRLRTAVVVATEDKPATITTTAGEVVLEDTVTHVHLRETIRGKPTVVDEAGSHWVYARSGTGKLMRGKSSSFKWGYLGEPLVASDIEAIFNPTNGRIDVFARTAEGRLRHLFIFGNLVHNGIVTSAPSAVFLSGGDVHVFALGKNSDVVTANVTSGTAQNLLSLGSFVGTSSPSAVSSDGTTIDIFVRGLDRALWRRHWNGAGWLEWESLGGVLATSPSTVSTGFGRIDVVALNDKGALIHRRLLMTGEWTDWADLGGSAQGEPSILGRGFGAVTDLIVVSVRGKDNGLRQILRFGERWFPWKNQGGNLSSPPATVLRDGKVHVYARGEDGTLAHLEGNYSSWGSWENLGDGIGIVNDRRRTRIFQISTEDVEFRNFDYPSQISGGRVAVRLSPDQLESEIGGFENLKKNRRIVLRSGNVQHLAKVKAVLPVASTPGERPDHLLVDFTPALPEALGETVLLGNIAQASHGETQSEETLGSGDATQLFQKFTLSHAPMTYLPSTANIAGEATLEIRINGERWDEVPSLYSRKPTERVYTARQTDDGETELIFGDGKLGSRLPTGPMNVLANYRKGLGLEGRVKAEQLSLLLERPVGLREVTNPFSADGGADPESLDNARRAAPATVRTFGRAVSLQDFEWIATTSGLVARAYVTWVWHELERAVHLTVASEEGASLSSTSLDTLYSSLTKARDPNRQLFLANLTRVPVVVRAKVLREPAFENDAVLSAANEALLSLFSFETVELGKAVHVSQVYSALQSAKGVKAVDVDVFHLKGYDELNPAELAVRSVTADPVQSHIRIFPARPTPKDVTLIDRYARAGFEGPTPPPVLPAEQAYIEDPVSDINISVVEVL